VELKKVTSTSVEVNVTNHKDEYGKIEYKWGDGNWEENKSAVSNLTRIQRMIWLFVLRETVFI